MALKDTTSAPVVRPQWAEPVMIKRLLDIGFYNFLMPFIESGDQARSVVAATRYPPQGIRGVGTAHRSNRYGYVLRLLRSGQRQHLGHGADREREGLKNIDDICAVDGVDGSSSVLPISRPGSVTSVNLHTPKCSKRWRPS